MALELSTIGITFGYAPETTAGTKPTTFTNIEDITSIGGLSANAEALEVTNLVDTWKRYIEGVKDTGGAMNIGANFTAKFKTTWQTLRTAAETAFADGKLMWFEVTVPNFGKFHFAGMPSDLPLPEIGVNDVFNGEVSIMPNKVDGWANA